MKVPTLRQSIDRVTLAIYLVALAVLLLAPVATQSDYSLLDIGGDKWVHFGLFCGLAALFRWNLVNHRRPMLPAAAATLAVALATEAAQSVVGYRSAELGDIAADLLGGFLGLIVMNKIMSWPSPEKAAGLIVTALGLCIGGLFVLADAIGVGSNNVFGPTQIAGALLGILIAAGGVAIYTMDRRRQAQSM